MAITPNTPPFVSGAILTAQQMTNLPMGTVGLTSSTSSVGFGGETTIITTTFTAVANRNYRIIWWEPAVVNAGAGGYSVVKIKNGATVLQNFNLQQLVASAGYFMSCQYIGSFTAGAKSITGTMISTSSGSCNRAADALGQMVIEDIGTA